MLFTDPLFLFYFLPAVLLLLRVVSWRGHLQASTKLLIFGSTLIFYAYENWLWIPVFAAVVGGTYVYGWLIASAPGSRGRRLWLAAAIVHCVLMLTVFKYLDWAVGFLPGLARLHAGLLPWFGHQGHIVLPPGISFYVFEAISYCFDIYRRKIEPPRNPLDFLCFIAMFPRFIAGPIVRYAEMEHQLRQWGGMLLGRGLTLFAVGFGLKSLFADQFAVFVPYGFSVSRPDFVQAWTGALAYTFQLYFDFWAYSIMAAGLGLCLGFEFPDNFRAPYKADSLTHFWRRWHISLSSWLRDYLYIGLGGNRHGAVRTYMCLLVTMTLGGLWHGANFTFLIWGLYHGLILAAERMIGEARLSRLPGVLRRAATFGLVVAGWVLFRSADLAQTKAILAGLVGAQGFAPQFNSLLLEKQSFAAALAVAGLAFFAGGERWLVRDRPIACYDFNVGAQLAIFVLFIVSLFVSLSSTAIPFLYFQF
jgi:alginate O-acetyltransferase complex protein AlgI